MSEYIEERTKIKNKICTVKDGRFVEPCDALFSVTDNLGAFSKARGVTRWTLTSMKTLKPSLTFFGVITKNHKNGLSFNYCPFCGESIDAPFADEPLDE